jgi:hypothetical protein
MDRMDQVKAAEQDFVNISWSMVPNHFSRQIDIGSTLVRSVRPQGTAVAEPSGIFIFIGGLAGGVYCCAGASKRSGLQPMYDQPSGATLGNIEALKTALFQGAMNTISRFTLAKRQGVKEIVFVQIRLS